MTTRYAQRGFTLLELMITVAIIAILASIALASYRSSIVRSNRSAAESFMYEVAAKQERYLLDRRQYTFTLSDLVTTPNNVSGNYTITIEDDDTASSVPGYVIKATPQGAQDSDDTACKILTLNHRGEKAASGNSTARCWQ